MGEGTMQITLGFGTGPQTVEVPEPNPVPRSLTSEAEVRRSHSL